MNTIPQTDPHASYVEYRDEIDRAINSVLAGGRFILGDEVSGFEKDFSSWCGVKYGIGVNSGTDALVLAMRIFGIGEGDTVITVSHTAVATVAAIEITGATPFLADIDPHTYTMSPGSLRESVEKIISAGGRPKAVIPVHLYGHTADMTSIMKIAAEYGLRVIEDCAQAHGASHKGRRAGSMGDVAAFSFYPTKNLGAFGDGGILVVDDVNLYEKGRALREYGWRRRFFSDMPGMNSRLDEIQAAILRVKLKYLDRDNGRRAELAAIYDANLHGVETPAVTPGDSHMYHQYVISTDKRDDLQKYLAEQGIMTAVHYPQPVHLQGAYSGRIKAADLSATESVMGRILSLPMYPQLEPEKVHFICDSINDFRR